MKDDPELLVERRGSVIVVRLNRPDARNAINSSMASGLGRALNEAESDPEIRAVVLTGAGDRAFCAGMDLRGFSRGEAMDGDEVGMATFHRLIASEIEVPLIGAANATAVAGGLELLLGCDLIVASSEAKFGLPEVKRGLFPAGSGTFLATRIPYAAAMELAITGESISAERAYELGLVNAVVPPAQVLGAALGYAERIASNGPLGVAAARELVRLAAADLTRVRDRMQELLPGVFGSADAKEGAAAFVEKRPPVWQGR